MKRKDFRAAIETAITSLFDTVYQGRPDTFTADGVDLASVAVIVSAGTTPSPIARDLFEDVNSAAIHIYIRRDAGENDSVEDTLDDTTEAVIDAVRGIHPSITFQGSNADNGAPNRRVGGKVYRYETIQCAVEDEIE